MNNDQKPTIAVVGASSDPEKYGHKIFRDLLKAGYTVTPVNPKGGELLGVKVYSTISSLSVMPDLVITVIPPPATESVVDECIAAGIKKIWMQPGSQNAKAVEKAKTHGIEVTYNACFMQTHGIWN